MTNNTGAMLKANLILRGKLKCITGLHIGGSKEKMEIGGVDSPVLRDPRTRYPYVPGSSLKGKLRSLLEFGLGVVPVDDTNNNKDIIAGSVSGDPKIVQLFGYGVDDRDKAEKQESLFRIGPSRLIIRDCYPDEETKKWWEKLDSELLYTEYKSENGINRITSAANPRFVERVAAGSVFDVEMVYSVYDIPQGKGPSIEEDLANLRMALLMLEHNYLGKSGTRGYGRIKFGFAEPVWIGVDDYINGNNDNIKKAGAAIETAFDHLIPTSELSLKYPFGQK